MPRFAANLSMMFNDVPFLDRFDAAANAGFTSVEFLFPYDHPAETVGERLKRNGLTQALFNLPPGNWDAGEKGFAALPDQFDDLKRSLETALPYAKATGVKRLHLMAGIASRSEAKAVEQFYKSVAWAAEFFAPHGLDVVIEPINAVGVSRNRRSRLHPADRARADAGQRGGDPRQSGCAQGVSGALVAVSGDGKLPPRHCERSEAIHRAAWREMDCFVATLLAMTGGERPGFLRHARACSGHPRLASLSCDPDVDGRDKPGHDVDRSVLVFRQRQPKRHRSNPSPAPATDSAGSARAAADRVSRSPPVPRSRTPQPPAYPRTPPARDWRAARRSISRPVP